MPPTDHILTVDHTQSIAGDERNGRPPSYSKSELAVGKGKDNRHVVHHGPREEPET